MKRGPSKKARAIRERTMTAMTQEPDWADREAEELAPYFGYGSGNVFPITEVAAALRRAKAEGKAEGLREAAAIQAIRAVAI